MSMSTSQFQRWIICMLFSIWRWLIMLFYDDTNHYQTLASHLPFGVCWTPVYPDLLRRYPGFDFLHISMACSLVSVRSCVNSSEYVLMWKFRSLSGFFIAIATRSCAFAASSSYNGICWRKDMKWYVNALSS